jgi:hypothetical protein
VRRDLWRAGKFLVLATVGLAAVAAFLPGRIEPAVRVYALVLCGAGLVLMVAALRRSYAPASPLRPATERRARERREVPGTLGRLEQEAALGVAGSFDLHHRLRPRLRGLASELLASRHAVSLDEEPERAGALLGEETWELVRADRPAPEDRQARGLPINELRRVVESLERL